MTVSEAKKIAQDFYDIDVPSDEDVFLFTEAMEFLIRETKDPAAMLDLGGYYYGERQFDLALKYYDMAAEYHYEPAYECLGYVWYYGRTGTRDYKKAFHYFNLSSEMGNINSACKLADMYKNGYYVEKDYETYTKMIEGLYERIKDTIYLFQPLPGIFARLAKIRAKQGRTDEAINLLLRAKSFLAQRIRIDHFWGDLNSMMWMMDDLYELMPYDPEYIDFYDLYYQLKLPGTVRFYYKERAYHIRTEEDNGEMTVCFGNTWYRSREDFFKKAEIDGTLLTTLYADLYGFEVER